MADLEQYIPARMQETRIPGLAVALVRDGQVAWAKAELAEAERGLTPDSLKSTLLELMKTEGLE